MSLLLLSANRIFQSSLPRQRFLLSTCRYLSTATNNSDVPQTQTDTQQSSSRRPRYRYYFLSIAAGALIGAAYTFRQSQKYEGLMPEYITNPELLERQSMDARPKPAPVTKHITFDGPSRINFPFKITLYQYVTWSALFIYSIQKFNKRIHIYFLVHSVVKFVHI